ncbi:MAG TPA: glucuronate isomerase [Armatimonadota bacterium]|nr:glucuronate isomerase [Armatimonadota bacterium]
MNAASSPKPAIREMVLRAMADTKVTDIHTHIYSEGFGPLLLWGIDELLTYHYLVAETMRWIDIPYDKFWTLSKRAQADLVWQMLFIRHSPYSEACRGVLTVLQELGLDVSSRNLGDYRAFFRQQNVGGYIDRVFELANVESVVMTNDPFDDLERPVWLSGRERDPRFHAALRIDALLNSWEAACLRLKEWGYRVHEDFSGRTYAEVRRFLREWIERMDALYMAASLPPSFAFPEDSARWRLIENCVLPVSHDERAPFALMIGVKKLVNPQLRLAGDSVGKGSIEVVEFLCANYPHNKFLVTMLSRENQHELCVAARKFRNLMVFGCWWFLNIPSVVEEMTRMRFELLGGSVIPQHSDARVLDQLVYKWAHSRQIIGEVLAEKYADLAATGWKISEDEIRRDVADLLGRNFWSFLGPRR